MKRDTTGNIIAKNALRELYHNYKGEALFFVVLVACIVLSHRLSRYIPVELFDKVVTPVQNGLAVTFCFVGAWLMFTHSEGIRVRKIWGCTLLTWGLAGGPSLRTAEEVAPEVARTPSSETVSIDESTHAEERRQLEAWMETAKPYLSPDFRLMDLNEVLPMNRTYLSQLINTEYGCTFYQFANHYRVEEAKRLLSERPFLTMQEVASLTGFSSRIVFSNAFTKETGLSPREWSKKCNNS